MRIHLPLPRLKINENHLKLDILVRLHANPFTTPGLKINGNRQKNDVLVRLHANAFTIPEARNQ